MTTAQILKNAKKDAINLTEEVKNAALLKMADAIEENADEILAENEKDVKKATGIISPVMIDRLSLSKDRIHSAAEGIRAVSALPDPVGRIIEEIPRPNGLDVQKISVPMGVAAIIYESRPNVTSDAAALCLKSSNVCVLRGGKEAYLSAKAIVKAMRGALCSLNLNPDLINLIEDTTRESAAALMKAVGYVDLLIPRGGKGLIDACVKNADVPCIQTGTGICHIYVDKDADFDMALNILENAKKSRPSVCNAAECMLVHRDIAPAFLPLAKERLTKEPHPVELRCDDEAYGIIKTKKADKADFDTEFLDYIMSVGIVGSVSEAVEHISLHSTGHSDCIVTNNKDAADFFVKTVDSAAVYVNASTRFTDGGEFGLGCEMGISTQKLHARGPMGLRELTSYKYVIKGNGQIR